MKLSAAFALLPDLRFAIQAALFPTFHAVLRSPSLLFRPTALSHLFMSFVWLAFGNGVDENGRSVKQALITENAYGVVLDIGAGHGHTVNYLRPDKVTKYIALEPNELMHPQIRSLANAAGFTESAGSLQIIPYHAQDTSKFCSLDGTPQSIDTLISVLALCTIPAPQHTLHSLVTDVLKPGGQLLFYEHVLSPRQDVAWWQRFWAPVWALAFDGCRLDRPTHLWVEKMGVGTQEGGIWREGGSWGKEGEDVESLFWHQAGRFVKA